MGTAELTCKSGCTCKPVKLDGYDPWPVSVAFMSDVRVRAECSYGYSASGANSGGGPGAVVSMRKRSLLHSRSNSCQRDTASGFQEDLAAFTINARQVIIHEAYLVTASQ